jgi:hypothetical protein
LVNGYTRIDSLLIQSSGGLCSSSQTRRVSLCHTCSGIVMRARWGGCARAPLSEVREIALFPHSPHAHPAARRAGAAVPPVLPRPRAGCGPALATCEAYNAPPLCAPCGATAAARRSGFRLLTPAAAPPPSSPTTPRCRGVAATTWFFGLLQSFFSTLPLLLFRRRRKRSPPQLGRTLNPATCGLGHRLYEVS